MISKKMQNALKGGSEIRKMFEEGGRLKAIYGAENVYDFSIGNPDLEPPKEVFDALKELAENPTPGMHGYMPNAGYPSTRQVVADKRGKEAGIAIGPEAVCMTVGAASAMNDVLHSSNPPRSLLHGIQRICRKPQRQGSNRSDRRCLHACHL